MLNFLSSRNLVIVLLWFLVAFAITSWSWFYGFIAFGLWISIVSFKRVEIELPPLAIFGCVFCISAFFSSVFGLDSALSWNSTCLKVSYLLLWVMLWNFRQIMEWRKIVLSAVIVLTGFYFVATVVRLLNWYEGWNEVANFHYQFQPILFRVRGVRNYVNELAVYCVLIFPVVFLLIRYTRSKYLIILYSVLAVVLLFVLLYCRSRASWISIVFEVSCIVFLFELSRIQVRIGLIGLALTAIVSAVDDYLVGAFDEGKHYYHALSEFHSVTFIIVAALVIFVLGNAISRYKRFGFANSYRVSLVALFLSVIFVVLIVCYFAIMPANAHYQSMFADSNAGRKYIWGCALSVLQFKPVFGVGSGCFGRAWSLFYDSSSSFTAMHGHNAILDILATQGVFGVVVFVSAITFLITHLFRKSVNVRHRIFVVVLAGCIAVIDFDSLFTSPANLALGLVIASSLAARYSSRMHRFTPGPMGLIAVLFVALPLEGAFRLQEGIGELSLGDEFMNSGNPDSALIHYKVAAEKRRDNPLVLRKLASASIGIGDQVGALFYLENAQRFEPTNVVNQINIASLCMRKNDTVQFVEALKTTRQIGRGIFEPYLSVSINRFGKSKKLSFQEYLHARSTDPLFPYSNLCQNWSVCRSYALQESKLLDDSGHVTSGFLIPLNPLLAIIYHKNLGQAREAKWLRHSIDYDYRGVSEGLFQFYVRGAPYPLDSRSSNIYIYGVETESLGILPEFEQLIRVDWRSVR